MELGTSLSILGGIYTPSYRERALLLKKHFSKLFPELYNRIPDLADKVLYYTKFKLYPNISQIRDPISLWFAARNYHKEVITYYIRKYLNVQAYNWFDFCFKTRHKLLQNYYIPILRRAFEMKLNISPNKYLLHLANFAFQFHERIKYMKRYGVFKYILERNISWSSPLIDFFIATLFLLHSPQNSGDINLSYIKQAIKLLGIRKELKYENQDVLWEKVRETYLETLKLLNVI